MKLDDLLDMLRAEFALDEPATAELLARWNENPLEPAFGIPEMLLFIERLAEVVQIVGMQGLGEFLQHVRSFAERVSSPGTVFSPVGAPSFTLPASVKWLGAWLEQTRLYLDKPADPAVVEGMAKYLYRCPARLPTDRVLELAAMLAEPPSLPAGDPDLAPLQQATDEDVGLPIDEVDGDLLQALLVDAPQQLEQLETTLQQWAAGTATAADMLEAQRISHTFKGSGNIIGLPGIGRVAHRLEDILEHALASIKSGQRANPAMARDTLRAVLSLQQMVAYLQGEEASPVGTKPVLQRLLDWVEWIRSGEADAANPASLGGALLTDAAQVIAPAYAAKNAIPNDLGDLNDLSAPAFAAPSSSAYEPPLDTQVITSQAAPVLAARDEAATLRVGVDRLSRMLRRAGQSIVQAQRMSQLMASTTDRLEAMVNSQQTMVNRLRELESLVGVQAVALREHQKDGDFDPLELDRYDALHGLSRSITEAVQDGQALVQQLRQDTDSASTVMRDESYALVDQHRELLAARLVPTKTMVPRLKRNVAQTASTTGKQVVLSIIGDTVTMDADVLTRLTEPLLHLLRNAVDHGIEMPEVRIAQGKPAQGTVVVAFRRVGQEVEIVVTDDGRGLDLDAIAQKAVAFGLIAPGATLSPPELRRMILRPGFSTRDRVTEISGRGVGLDVVNDRISALKGRLAIDSAPAKGSQFTLHVPVSGGVAHALIVQCSQESVALSADQVMVVLPAGQGELTLEGQQRVLTHEGVSCPAFVLAQWLGFEESSVPDAQSCALEAAQLLPVLVRGAEGTTALLVNAVLDSRELILQDIGRLARRLRGVVAGALRADGKPLFLIDVAELERAARSSVQLVSTSALRKRLQVERTRILVVDDALSVRRSMEQLLGDAGYDVAAAADGFEAIEQIRLKRPALILTDLEMPNLNGLELTRRIREVPQWMDLPVVMITSRAGDKHRAIAADAGVDVYLTKPYLDADLLTHVRQLCDADAQSLLI